MTQRAGVVYPRSMNNALGAVGVVVFAVATSCQKPPPPPPPAPALPSRPPYSEFARDEFNRRAAERFLPIFWRSDDNGDGKLDPAELATLVGFGAEAKARYVDEKGDFTAQFIEAWALLKKEPATEGLNPDEAERRAAVRKELSQGKPTLVETDFSSAKAQEVEFVSHIVAAMQTVERLFARQRGVLGVDAKIPADDLASRMMFHRNQGPFCVAPQTENDPRCRATPEVTSRKVGLYPATTQDDPKFCDKLSKAKNAKALMDHFSTVVEGAKPDTFEAKKYSEAFGDDMQAVSRELQKAAALADEKETALKAYLEKAAAAFATNDWETANVAWAAMGATNSRFYLRIAPDEVYEEPCSWKAGFGATFAHINPDSLAWQAKLEPVKLEMEKFVAGLAGAPYKAREVKFKLPDFIDIILNTGDARDAHGATIGQSLPNWGKVAETGGRTVTMTNLYTDLDSRAALKGQAESLFCPDAMKLFTSDPKPALMSVVLHEAAHNLGPAHEYKVAGKVDDVAFGGPLAATMEELKAQTLALRLPWWLAEKGIIDANDAAQGAVRDVAWAFGHISRGMYTGSGAPKNYSQLASIQLGSMIKAGALKWAATTQAANGRDTGCFEMSIDAWKPAVDGLAHRVLQTKARADKAEAEKMKAEFVDARDDWEKLRATITERWLRAPKATFVYSLKLPRP